MASTFRSSLCALCSSPPVYTCPRCSLQTCSLPCIKTHKLKYSCSGERDPTAYIPLRDVGQGVWADDYRWLEEGRRKVASWGEGLPRDAVVSGGRGRGGRGGRQRLRVTRGKMDILGMELRRRGCEVKFMPEGMGRRKLNQSSWNPR